MKMKPKMKTNNLTKAEFILNSALYQNYIDAIAQREETRRFCKHERHHFWETARCAYILFLSGEVACPELEAYDSLEQREIIYAAAFLHDIGRFLEYDDPQKDHATEGARLARPLLKEAGFDEAETMLICKAIANHRKKDGAGFDLLLYRADKVSRPCFDCPVLGECKKFSPENLPRISI